MKQNPYIYIVPLDSNYHVIFNGITKDFLPLKNEHLDSYVLLLRNPDKYIETHKSLIEKFLKYGFILKDGFNAQHYLAEERNEYIISSEYKTSIIPTFECNYSCWYCIQKRQSAVQSEIKSELIIKHIKKYLIENEIKSYVLSWFGGEPLMRPDLIDSFTKKLKEFCKENEIHFSAAITSNGSLLTLDAIRMLKRNDVNFYQIAIDGDLPSHDKVKFDDSNKSSFALILTNIINLLDENPDANVVLRLNYTIKMLKSQRFIKDLNSYIPQEYRGRLSVDLQKVWQIKEEKIPMETLRDFQKNLSDAGYILNTDHVFSMCYVEKKHYNMIYYNGGVEKCDKRGMDNLRGYLNQDGDIVWKEAPIFGSYGLFDEDCCCGKCQYYPLCYCGCPVEREEKIVKNKKIICGHYGDYSIFNLRIQDYCWRVLHNKKIRLL